MQNKWKVEPWMVGAAIGAIIMGFINANREEHDRQEMNKLVEESTDEVMDRFRKEQQERLDAEFNTTL